MEHDVNLNIHYTLPDELWEKISDVYRTMPYWAGTEQGPEWKGEDIDLWASVEPGGIQIAGTMPDEIWEIWYDELKAKLAEALGYDIGEPEDGFEFRYWE
ncbi:MAG: hypothetical protein K2O34_05510 [Acetatifactor sp.]|nr:hypothetical protein [Acetatifactor sp.]